MVEIILLPLSICINIIAVIWLIYLSLHSKKHLISTLERPISQGMEQVKDLQNHHTQKLYQTLFENQEKQNDALNKLTQSLQNQSENNLHRLQLSLGSHYAQQHKQLHDILSHSTKQLHDQFQSLGQSTERHMLAINQSIETRLSKGFEKTNETFTQIVQRLAIIDDAQRKITDLSKNVINLQDILRDKRSRGAFGEIQLKALVSNLLPAKTYAFQHTLSTGTRADCLLFLPPPTSHIVIDSKFPLENYQKMLDFDENMQKKSELSKLFKQDVKKHIQDINTKYIVPNETADGAIMFIPAEAVFAEIHAHHSDLVELSYQKKVWMASPTTLMAILTTAQSVIKDDATRQQIHVIQKHLKLLAQDFTRFEKRMDNLTKHLQQANVDAEQVHTSAKKIANKFNLIEQVELSHTDLLNPSNTHPSLGELDEIAER